MPTDLSEEIRRINEELEQLRLEQSQLEQLRKARIERIRLKVLQLPKSFAVEHPIIAEALSGARAGAGYLKEGAQKVGKFLIDNQLRAQSNEAFASGLRIGERAINPETKQEILKNADGSYTPRFLPNQRRKIIKV